MAFFIAVLAITGLLVQHAHELGLDRRFLGNKVLFQWYGLTPDPVVSYRAGAHWVSHAGEYLYVDGKPVEERFGDLHGAAEAGLLLAVISADSVVLLTRDAELVERIDVTNGLPEPPLEIIKQATGEVIINGQSAYWLPDSEWLTWYRYTGVPSKPAAPDEPPQSILRNIQHHNLRHELTWERVLLDLHSGRVLANGRYIMDIAAVGMLFLAFSGILIWTQRRPHRRFRKIQHR
jgi:hypothetical protein